MTEDNSGAERAVEADGHEGHFATTHWSLVLRAAAVDSPAMAAAALETLCQTYWYPLYVYVRRRGHGPSDAQDLTQQFFARFLEQGSFARADPTRGRFRSFLLKSLQHFLLDDWKRAHRAKRGGGMAPLALDSGAAEHRFAAEAKDRISPELAYDERWALTLLDRVLKRLGEEYARAGKTGLFAALQEYLWGSEGAAAYGQIAPELGMTEGALRVAVHRVRTRYRELLRAEVGHTVHDPTDIDEELHYLIRVVGGDL
jgi:RNA polymerase sigma-70 factor (ECF subfamily)